MKKRGPQEFSFTIKTPVHVGSGEKLGKIDFILQTNQCVIINIDDFLYELRDNPSALNEFGGEHFNISNFLKQYKIPQGKVQRYSLPNPDNIKPFNIQELVKTGMGNPLLPGTSIKGAIRTVILWHLFKNADQGKIADTLNTILNSNVKKEQADGDLDHFLFGSNPNHDFMRSLQVGDVEFNLSDMRLLETKVLSLTQDNGFGWKKMGKDGFNDPNPKKATSICCESLALGATSNGRIKMDNFLFADTPAVKQELGFSDKREMIADLPQKCNEYAKTFIAGEIAFFENCRMNDMVSFYTALQEEIPQGNDSFILHLGWGSGWRGMTGNYLSEDNLEAFKKRFGLGKLSFPVFPKTRKIAFEKEKPKYPLGWIKIEKIKEEMTRQGQPVPITITTVTQKPKTQSELEKNFEAFRLSPSPENFNKFIDTIKEEDTAELEKLSFKGLKNSVNIGFASPLIEADMPLDLRKILAIKMLEVLEKNKKWSDDKLAKYKKLQEMVKQN